MPRYYLDVSEPSRFLADDEGAEFVDDSAAELAAVAAAVEICRETCHATNPRQVSIQLRNADGKIIATVTSALRIDRNSQ